MGYDCGECLVCYNNGDGNVMLSSDDDDDSVNNNICMPCLGSMLKSPLNSRELAALDPDNHNYGNCRSCGQEKHCYKITICSYHKAELKIEQILTHFDPTNVIEFDDFDIERIQSDMILTRKQLDLLDEALIERMNNKNK
jgi:hypothetical protein